MTVQPAAAPEDEDYIKKVQAGRARLGLPNAVIGRPSLWIPGPLSPFASGDPGRGRIIEEDVNVRMILKERSRA